MAEVIWTKPALSALNDVAEYIALDNPSAAKHFVKEVFILHVMREERQLRAYMLSL